MKSDQKAEAFNPIEAFTFAPFRRLSAFVLVALVGACVTNYFYCTYPHGPILWFLIVERLANTVRVASVVFGYFGLLILPLSLKAQRLGNTKHRNSERCNRTRFSRIGTVVGYLCFLWLLLGMKLMLAAAFRIDGIVNELSLLAGLEIAEAWFWQRARCHVFRKLLQKQ